jgi:hypothetical protein
METGSWVEQEHSIWKVLPLRPHPEPLESITSYIMRLTQANGLQSINELAALAGALPFSSLRSFDYPTLAYPDLAHLTGYPQEQWLCMTFFHLVQHFGYSMNRYSLHKFLQGSLATCLRYCPICLAEHNPAYYSLLWRFLVLPGCIEHGVCFLDQCCFCRSPLPLLRRIPQLTKCPACQRDLRGGIPALLSNDVLEPTALLTKDLKMLLTPGPRYREMEQAKLIGKRFQFLRQCRNLLIPEVAFLMRCQTSVVRDIGHVSKFRQANLGDYMQYAHVLGYSLCEIFDQQSLEELLAPVSEEQLLNQVEEAIHQLKARGKPILTGSIGDLVGMTGSRLKQYPRLKKLLVQYEKERKQEIFLLDSKLEDDLVKRVEQTLEQLEACGEPIVLQHVCNLVGLSYAWMVKRYPRIKALFHEYHQKRSGYKRPPRRNEEEKVQQVQAAIDSLVSHGEPVTLRQIRQIVRLTQRQLRSSPRVKALLVPYIEKWQADAS